MFGIGNHPASWLTSATILRGGGRDPKGNPLPVTEVALDRCLVAGRSTEDPVDRSEVTDGKAVMYTDPGVVVLHSDRVRIPEGARMAGVWAVDGRPSEWPFGVEVGLVRDL